MLAFGISLAVNVWVSDLAPHAIVSALTRPVPGGSGTAEPILSYAAPVLAFMTAAGVAQRPRWWAALALVLSLDGLAALVSGYADGLSLILTLLIGWTVAHGTSYALGSPNVRPTTERLFTSLRQLGFTPTTAFRAPHAAAHEPRRYLVHQTEERPDLDVVVLDRELSASGFFHQVGRRLLLRTAPRRRSLLSLRGSLRQEALLSFAAEAAGVRTRRLLATAELGPDAAVAVYEQLDGRTLDELSDAELTDPLLTDAWRQLNLLHVRRTAHRSVGPASLLVDPQNAVYLVNLHDGDIAAGDIALRMDLAQLLTTLALRVGPARAVASAFAVLGPDQVGSAVPLLQPLALSRSTRAALKRHRRREQERIRTQDQPQDREPSQDQEQPLDQEQPQEQEPKQDAAVPDQLPRPPDLLAQIRDEILHRRPQAVVQVVRLERVRLRTLVTLLGGATVGYFLLFQLPSKSATALTHAQVGWVVLAAAAAVAGFVAATMSFVGFVPERLNIRRAALVQLAGAFVNLVTPSGVGGMALNTRFLQRAGVQTRKAVASVGVTQAVGLVLHILLILVFGYLASARNSSPLSASPVLLVGLLVAALLVLLAGGIPPLRRWITTRLQPMLTGVVPRLLDVLQHRRKLAVGIIGQLLVSLVSAACLYFCARGFGQHPNFAAVAVANLVGGTVGSAVPVPGGVGAVESALSAALAGTTGVPLADAFLPVLVFRLLTFWLPVLPGWIAFLWLQRRDAF